ncbi:MAG: BrnT family toxin [Nitrospirota bacterium]|nr:BrnT family toxin [Nitrospirota bacterium]
MFEWDEKKNRENLANHGVDFDDAEHVFESPTFTFKDTRFEYGETRYITFGLLEGRMVVVAHTPRGNKTRIISMRKGNDREQKTYKKQLKETRRDDG